MDEHILADLKDSFGLTCWDDRFDTALVEAFRWIQPKFSVADGGSPRPFAFARKFSG